MALWPIVFQEMSKKVRISKTEVDVEPTFSIFLDNFHNLQEAHVEKYIKYAKKTRKTQIPLYKAGNCLLNNTL